MEQTTHSKTNEKEIVDDNLQSSDSDISQPQTSPLKLLWSIVTTIAVSFFFKIFGGLIG